MKTSLVLIAPAGLLAFATGAYFAGTGQRGVGIALMMLGLVLQVITLAQFKRIRKKGAGNARG
ncbi:MAG: hypothetical protein WA918_00785 [Erythrobacter sp.]